MSRGLKTFGWIVSVVGAAWLGRATGHPHSPPPVHEEARSSSTSTEGVGGGSRDVDGLRLQVATLLSRLAAAERQKAPEPAPAPPEPKAAPVDPTLDQLEEKHATGARDQDAAGVEAYLRDVAGKMAVPLPLRSVSCTKEICRLEVAATTDGRASAAVTKFLGLIAGRLPQSVLQPDPGGGGAVVMLARDGTSLSESAGGGLAE
jgi:hypothetical protein